MTFSAADARERRERDGHGSATPAEHPFAAPRAAGLLIQPGPLVASVASRVTAILAARADFPLDRLADAVLVSDAISAHASDYIAGSDVGIVIEDGDGTLEFPRVGPLHQGGGEGLLRRDGGAGPGPLPGAAGGRGQDRTGRGRSRHGGFRGGRRVPLALASASSTTHCPPRHRRPLCVSPPQRPRDKHQKPTRALFLPCCPKVGLLALAPAPRGER